MAGGRENVAITNERSTVGFVAMSKARPATTRNAKPALTLPGDSALSWIGRDDSKMTTLLCALLAVVTLVVYWQVNHFHLLGLDDELYVSNNAFVTNGLSLDGAREAFLFNGYAGNWHPLTWLSLMADTSIYGPMTSAKAGLVREFGPISIEGYHLTNLLLHVINCVLLFVLARWLTGSAWRGGFVAGLFALHPLHVESVAWVSERKDVLSTFFWFATILVYIAYAKSIRRARAGNSTVTKSILLKYFLVLICFGLGLLSKPMLVTLPLTLLLIDFWPLQRFSATTWRPFIEKLPLFAMSLVSSVITYIVQSRGGAVTAPQGITIPMRLATACVAYMNYLVKMIWPWHLAPMYPYPVRQDPVMGIRYLISPAIIITAAACLIAITAGALLLRRKAPCFTFGWFWYLITLLPVIGLVQVGYQARADRYTYVPLIGIFVFLACVIPQLTRRFGRTGSQGLTIAGFGVLAVFACMTHAQASWWHDSRRLYDRALEITPDNWFMRNALGHLLLKEDEEILRAQGPTAGAYQITLEARRNLELGIEVDPGIADLHNNLGVAYRALSYFPNLGENSSDCLSHALSEFQTAVRMDPSNREGWLNQGLTLTQMQKPNDALVAYEQARRLRPEDPQLLFQVAKAEETAGQEANAADRYESLTRLPRIDPFIAYWSRVDLAAIRLRNGQEGEAEKLLRQAVELNSPPGIDPGNQASQYLNQLGAGQP